MTDLSTGTEPRTVANVLSDAADYIERYGLDQYRTPSVCVPTNVVGAIVFAITGNPIGEDHPVSGESRNGPLLEAAFMAFVDRGIGSTITYPSFYTRMNRTYTWGSAEGRTAAEVVAKLREVAAAERVA